MTMTTAPCNCKLPGLVESHDLAGLQKAIEDPNLTCYTYPCHFQPGLNKHMRDFILENQSAVERACVLGHLDMLELFLHNGCSANLPTSHGRLIHTVLTSLKSHRHLIDNNIAVKMIRLLMSMDCDVNVKDYKGKSPLLLASELADPAIMREILYRCLDWQLSCPDISNGFTPLHMACMNGSVECVSLLLKRLTYEDTHVADFYRVIPLHCTLLVLKNNLQFHSKEWWKDSRLLQVQYSHIAIAELLIHQKSSASGPIPQKGSSASGLNPHLPFTADTVIYIALETAHQFEVIKKMNHSKWTKLSIDDCTEIDRSSSVGGLDQKVHSPYAELCRMLLSSLNTNPLLLEDLQSATKTHPCIQGLLNEICEYITLKMATENIPASLMNQARRVIHLHVAKCDKLSLLEQLPLPRKLKDFVRFMDF